MTKFNHPDFVVLDEFAQKIHATAVEKGFWDDQPDINFMLAKLALIHSEVSETLEAMRKQMGQDKIEEELADILIRLLDFVEGAKTTGWINTQTMFTDVVLDKMAVNRDRPNTHGNLA